MKLSNRLLLGLAVLVVISPLGLIVPDSLRSGPAWGEWSVEEVAKLTGYFPQGLKKLSGLWRAPLPDYTLGNPESASRLGYLISGFIGSVIVLLVVFLIGKKLSRKNE